MLAAFVAGATFTTIVLSINRIATINPPRYAVPLFELREGENARTTGNLIPGSLRMRGPCERLFAIEDDAGFRVPVRFKACVVPDPFEAAAKASSPTPVIVEGVLTPHGFEASAVLTRTSCCYCKTAER